MGRVGSRDQGDFLVARVLPQVGPVQLPRRMRSAYEAAILTMAEKHQGRRCRSVGRVGECGALERKSWTSREKGVLEHGRAQGDAVGEAGEGHQCRESTRVKKK